MPDSDNVRVSIHHPDEYDDQLSVERLFLIQRLPGKFKESGVAIPEPDVYCHGSKRVDIFISISGLSLLPQVEVRRSVIRLIECTTRNNVGNDSIPITLVDEDDVARLGNLPPRFASIGNAQPLPT